MIKIRGIDFQENLNNPMGLHFTKLSHRWGFVRDKFHLSLFPTGYHVDTNTKE